MRLSNQLLEKDALDLVPLVLGSTLVRKFNNGTFFKDIITEIEVYRGEEDLACHASKGRTKRTEIMYASGGFIYVYLIYGMYWMLNIVTGPKDMPQALLIRSTRTVKGPGRLGKALKLDKSFYGEDLGISSRIWLERDTGNIENFNKTTKYQALPRIGVSYAGPWALKPWRFVLS